jgi:Fe-S-cluster-containing dehydrogenase component/anaerobic selenocysteine-containing dehydrogenase
MVENKQPLEMSDAEFNRRTFLKLAGFAFAGAIGAGCERAPERNAFPPLVLAEDAIPGRPLLYASTCGGCNAGCGVVVKTLDGRPIKLEGNPNHPLSKGGLCAAGQASILGLYDRLRLQHPLKHGTRATWNAVDSEIRAQLDEVGRQGKKVRFLSGTITSPTTRQAIANFLAGYPGARHVVHDSFSCSAIREAHFQTHGMRALPHYHLEQAEVIVSFAADFLGTWIAPVAFAADYQAGRYLQGPAPHLSYHVQVESRLSLTGSKADQRLCVTPGEFGMVMTQLAARVAQKAGLAWDRGAGEAPPVPAAFLDDLAQRLWTARGRCLVLCDSEDVALQLLGNFLNHLLQNYGTTLDLAKPSYQNQSNDRDLAEMLEEIRQGQVGALFVYRSNPLYDFPEAEALGESLRSVPLVVSFASALDETASKAHYVCPEPHYLESWNDAEAVDGVVSLYQPTFQPLGESRPVLETLAAWQGRPRSAYDQLRDSWQARVYPRTLITISFQEFWDQAVQDGSVRVKAKPVPQLGASTAGTGVSPMGLGPIAATAAIAATANNYPAASARPFNQAAVSPIRRPAPSPEGSFTLILYAKVGISTGSHAYNPWLQELPDPLTKITWDNYACLSPTAAARLGLSQGDVVRLQGAAPSAASVELPVVIQPGQHDQVVAVALGYGSKLSERFADIGPPWLEARPTLGANGKVGVNASPLLTRRDGALHHISDGVLLEKTSRRQELACTQDQPTLRIPSAQVLGRQPLPIIRETTLPALVRAGQSRPPAEPSEDLWPDDHPITGPRWGLAIDLNACTGCSACVIACQVENNIPVVGKDEVRRHREMHWMRIDRYYSTPSKSPVDGAPTRDNEVDVAHQPMLCQHCGNAPCEVVCPVLATVHSDEGLNQQVYNRCVGTRYCANNCPYKVRRFNWFDYAHDDLLQNLVLNPDVTVRSRGVMEKCTLCVQRIQEGKIAARRLGRAVADGDIQTACQQSCPTKVIVFGDLNDPQSRAARLAKSTRAYHVLEELNVKSAVSYLAVVRNRPAEEGAVT